MKMAYNHASVLFLIALILFATANPLAHGVNITYGGLSVASQLCCTPTGTCPGQGVSGAVVNVNCTKLGGASVVIGQNATGLNGFFNITVGNIEGVVVNQTALPCVATVLLPLSSTVCPVLSTLTGVLAGIVIPVGSFVSETLGLVRNATVTGFVNVKI